MKKKYLILLLAFKIVICYSQSFNTNDIETTAQYIIGLQYSNPSQTSYGAIKKSNGLDIFNNQYYYKIEPYFSHIGCLGLLESNNSDRCNVVKKWMTWYLNHLNNNGLSYNYYIKPDGTGETSCPPGGSGIFCNYIDAEDSDPALFFY